MSAAISLSEPNAADTPFTGRLARVEGRLDVVLRLRAGRAALAHLFQEGAARVRLPRPLPGRPLEIALINLAGGITGGDRMTQSLHWGEGVHAVATTQAAEKIYRASADAAPARIDNRLALAAKATAEWLPQETILFNRARLHRRLLIDMAADARFLGCEAIIFGRGAMGETVESGFLQDSVRLSRAGDLLFADGLRLDGAIQAVLDRPAVAAGARALATLIYAAPDADTLVEPVRGLLDEARSDACRAAISCRDGVMIGRFLAADGRHLRKALGACLPALRHGLGSVDGLPKMWSC